ncbi:MAG: zf-HC2 domain-containing protein [Bacteroidota bacterium]
MTPKRNAPAAEISCRESIRRVFEYIDGELPEAGRRQVERHLATCRHCFDRYEFERLLKSRLRRIPSGTPSAELRRRIRTVIESFSHNSLRK